VALLGRLPGEGSRATRGAKFGEAEMQREDVVEEVRALAFPGLSSADRLRISDWGRGCIRAHRRGGGGDFDAAVPPFASDLHIAISIAKEVSMTIYEMVGQARIVSVNGDAGATSLDVARYGRGGEEEERETRVNGEEVMQVGVVYSVSSNDSVAFVEAANNEGRGVEGLTIRHDDKKHCERDSKY
jgi:hypothetical protein